MRAWVSIDLEAIRHNAGLVRQEVGQSVELMAVVKTDAYGHGISKVVSTIDNQVDSYAVISLEEAAQVRRHSDRPILVMSYLDTKEITDAIEEDYTLSLYDKDLAATYERFAQRLGRKLKIQLKVETGLNRLGVSPEEAESFLVSQHLFPHLELTGIYSHLIKATDTEQSRKQLRKLQSLVSAVADRSKLVPIHLASSYSLGHFKDGYLDGVRVGLSLYGVDEVLPGTQAAMSCKAIIMQVKNVEAGEGVSYGHLYNATRPIKIAILPVGYGEGLSQALTGHLTVLVAGQERPVVGQICMNHIVVDVTDQEVSRGDEAVLIGSQKDEKGNVKTIRVADVAKRSNIRHHEIITRLGNGLPRIY